MDTTPCETSSRMISHLYDPPIPGSCRVLKFTMACKCAATSHDGVGRPAAFGASGR